MPQYRTRKEEDGVSLPEAWRGRAIGRRREERLECPGWESNPVFSLNPRKLLILHNARNAKSAQNARFGYVGVRGRWFEPARPARYQRVFSKFFPVYGGQLSSVIRNCGDVF